MAYHSQISFKVLHADNLVCGEPVRVCALDWLTSMLSYVQKYKSLNEFTKQLLASTRFIQRWYRERKGIVIMRRFKAGMAVFNRSVRVGSCDRCLRASKGLHAFVHLISCWAYRVFNAFLLQRRRQYKVQAALWIIEFLQNQRETTRMVISAKRFRNAGLQRSTFLT